MSTVFVGERPPEVDAWLQRRRELGQDLFDEVWEGSYHVAPAPHRRHGDIDDQVAFLLRPAALAAGLHPTGPCNLGVRDDYRVPDRAYLRSDQPLTYEPTAALVVEIHSPGDETYRKLDFYLACGVDELLVVDPQDRTVQWFARGDGAFVQTGASELIEITADGLAADIDWPA
ncbi:MAG: Uma2 family endonuclease [Iamia sp.]